MSRPNNSLCFVNRRILNPWWCKTGVMLCSDGTKRCGRFAKRHGIIYQGFSLLTANREVLVDPEMRTIATRVGTGPAQVIFRFAMQIGMLPLTGTTSQQHMKEDLQAEQLALSPEEIRRIETIAL